ncbi:MAG: ATPase domain-containing protein [bacterium]|nr:ATPase domain-containing protein [bacterium]
MDRIKTGIENLDMIFGGGVPIYSVNVVAGTPGTGKTILLQQMMFYNAAPETKGLYITTLSEPTVKVVRYQQQFKFFLPEKVGKSVFFADIGTTIRNEGLPKTVDVILNFIKEIRPTFVVIDSFKAIHDLAPSVHGLREFVYDLAVKMAVWKCTTFLIGEYSEKEIEQEPEFAVADGIIRLENVCDTELPMRYLSVIKMRGSNFFSGKHSYIISEEGINIFPRQISISQTPEIRRRILKTGMPGVDKLLGGGLPSQTSLLVAGTAGSGKTTFSLKYLYSGATEYDEPGILFLYEETVDQIINIARGFGWDFAPLIKEGKIKIIYSSISDLNLDEHLLKIKKIVTETGAQRIVVDSLPCLLHQVSEQPYLVTEKAAQLTNLLKGLGTTALFVSRTPMGTEQVSKFGVEESLVDGIMILRIIGDKAKRKRSIEIYKLRNARHVLGECRMVIGNEGVKVLYTGN